MQIANWSLPLPDFPFSRREAKLRQCDQKDILGAKLLKNKLTQVDVKELFDYVDDHPDALVGRRGHLIHRSGRMKGKFSTTVPPSGYKQSKIKGKFYSYSHVVWLWHKGVLPKKGFQIDHINRIPWDNRIENLREVTPSENAFNKRMPKSNTSGVIGVNKSNNVRNSRSPWRAGITRMGISRMKYFKTKEEAIAQIRKWEEEFKRTGKL